MLLFAFPFNSRPSCEGRPARACPCPRSPCFNSRPSCEGRPAHRGGRKPDSSFNSRPSCEGRPTHKAMLESAWFQFTPLVRGATPAPFVRLDYSVSIHAPRARGDWSRARSSTRSRFNSRPSCEGRHVGQHLRAAVRFQFTPLVRGATAG